MEAATVAVVKTLSSSATLRERAAQYSPAQRRTIDTALELFADHGVSGTSFQMIADALGVTKAAVYHQFKTKDAIVIAVLEVNLAHLEDALEAAEAGGAGPKARAALLSRVIDVAVERRRAVGALQGDPVLVRLLGDYEPSRVLWNRLFGLLVGDDLTEKARVRAAVLSAAIGSVSHAFVADIDDEALKTELFQLIRTLIVPRG
jgi:AcrR family transcriptional regulator